MFREKWLQEFCDELTSRKLKLGGGVGEGAAAATDES
jgi:hypothetical protein